MQKKTQISIIVPVYNTEDYLRKCIDSIISQSFADWECILIDDGSTDDSPQICDEYAEKDARIKAFHKKNGGVSLARNIGIDNADGEWITFIDSDDYFAETYLDDAYRYIVDNQDTLGLLWTNYKNVVEGRIYDSHFTFNTGIISSDEIPSLFRKEQLLRFVTCWAKFYKKSIIHNYSVSFPRNISKNEDFCFVLNYLKAIYIQDQKIMLLNSPSLYHVSNSNGLSSCHLSIESELAIMQAVGDAIHSWIIIVPTKSVDILELYRTVFVRAFHAMASTRSYKEFIAIRRCLKQQTAGVKPIETTQKWKWIIYVDLPKPISYIACVLNHYLH